MELGSMAFGNSRGIYTVNRDWQGAFCARLNEMGFDGYGNPDNDNRVVDIVGTDGGHYKFETDTFVIMPYYWGDDDDIAALPNFVYKPDGFELSWYKYALRDSYMNRDVSFAQLDEMLRKCCESLKTEASE